MSSDRELSGAALDFRAPDAGDSRAARLRARQIQALTRFTPIALIVNIVNAILVAHVVLPAGAPLFVALWVLAIAVVMLVGFLAWLSRRDTPPRETVSPRALRHATIQGTILGVLWGFAPAAWFAASDLSAQLVISNVMAGMIGAGGFALTTVKRAAVGYVVPLTLGSLTGLFASSNPHALVLAALLTAYATVVLCCVHFTSGLFVRQVLGAIDLEEKGEVIGLLVAEFEQNGSDWLFELDQDGRITRASRRFGVVTESAYDSAVGRQFEEFLEEESRARFRAALAAGHAFRGLEFAALQGARWWSLTMRPILHKSGRRTGWRGVGSDISAAKTAQDRLTYLATTDIVTGLMNRPGFLDAAAAACRPRAGVQPHIAIGFLDLDEFKIVNDTLGHQAGDQLLQRVARHLEAAASDDMRVARLGGDEFGLLFLDAEDHDAVKATAQRLLDSLCRRHVIEGTSISTAASIGVAFGPDDGTDVASLMRKADTVLYRAKEAGGRTVMVYDEAMHRATEDRYRLREDLSRALERNELFLVYQPTVDIATRATVGFEALLRWQHPERGVVTPSEFIPIAEQYGLIRDIGVWILGQACRDAACWPEELFVSVNVSAAQLADENLSAVVAGALQSAGLSPRRLELEITETLFLRRETETLAFLRSVRDMGVSIALDDFGTGFSSLGYLGRFPIDKLKIDRSFVSGPGTLVQRTAIVQAVISMARSLGMTTTAEGVEDEASLAWLRLHGCTLAQGYLFAEPMRAEWLAAFLARMIREPQADRKLPAA
ncbi:EAL domain-containing protein [Bradyrhizobium diazoefficiens]|nr:EAL domain-containing protein [Bradyrhizobium diazoefficiens]MBR0852741.1 EAL domain-containing protein [Bradyrhizobium diazoefficiens]